MLWYLGPYELIILFVLWLVLIFGLPSAIGVYIWKKRFSKKKPPEE